MGMAGGGLPGAGMQAPTLFNPGTGLGPAPLGGSQGNYGPMAPTGMGPVPGLMSGLGSASGGIGGVSPLPPQPPQSGMGGPQPPNPGGTQMQAGVQPGPKPQPVSSAGQTAQQTQQQQIAMSSPSSSKAAVAQGNKMTVHNPTGIGADQASTMAAIQRGIPANQPTKSVGITPPAPSNAPPKGR